MREAPDDPERLCDHLLRTLIPATGATDDVAILALRNLPVTDRFTVSFPAEPEALAPMRAMLRRWLSHPGGGEFEITEIVMACGEAATNAIEHAGERARCPSWSPGDCGTGGWRSRSATRGPGACRARGITGAARLSRR